jgi:hypothetical protein
VPGSGAGWAAAADASGAAGEAGVGSEHRAWRLRHLPIPNGVLAVSVGIFSPRRFRTARRLDSGQLFPQSAFALNPRGKRSHSIGADGPQPSGCFSVRTTLVSQSLSVFKDKCVLERPTRWRISTRAQTEGVDAA